MEFLRHLTEFTVFMAGKPVGFPSPKSIYGLLVYRLLRGFDTVAPLERALMKEVKGVFARITATILIVALPLLVADLVFLCAGTSR